MAAKEYRPKSGNEGLVLTIANGEKPLEIKDWPYTPEDASVEATLAEHELLTDRPEPKKGGNS